MKAGKTQAPQQQQQAPEATTKAEKTKKAKAQNVLTESQQNEIKKAFDYFDITGSGNLTKASLHFIICCKIGTIEAKNLKGRVKSSWL